MKIILEHVTKVYEDTNSKVLDNFSMVVEKGEFVLLTGESGIGKTTLLRLLLRDINPDRGKIQVGEYDLGILPENKVPYYRRKLGCT